MADDPADAFEEYLRSFPLQKPAPMPTRRRTFGWYAAAAVVLCLLAGGTVMLILDQRSRRPALQTDGRSVTPPRRALSAGTLTRAWMRSADALDAALDDASTLPNPRQPGGALARLADLP